jgi:pseudoazurin
MTKTVTAIVLGLLWTVSFEALGDEIEVRSLNRSPTGLFVFSPDLVRIKPGDTINFVATDKGHEVHSVPGMIPDSARPFDAKMSQDIKVTFTVPGVYVIACRPHTAMGMVAVVLVGDAISTNRIDPSTLPDKARTKLDNLLEQLKKS